MGRDSLSAKRISLYTRAQGYLRRRSSRYLCRRLSRISTPVPIVSFTFDDFPRSALLRGGAILNSFGLSATYYAAFGLMGTDGPVGPIFVPDDLETLSAHGHELGCHTFDHLDSARTGPRAFEESIIRNRKALGDFLPGASFRTFAYPISEPWAWTKRRTARHFVCSRLGGQRFNHGTVDFNNLAGYFLEKSGGCLDAVRDVIERNRRARGWLILATHDVCEDPSPFGCTPQFFTDVVRCALDSGARIEPVIKVCETLRACG